MKLNRQDFQIIKRSLELAIEDLGYDKDTDTELIGIIEKTLRKFKRVKSFDWS
jgi:hypothetical protein